MKYFIMSAENRLSGTINKDWEYFVISTQWQDLEYFQISTLFLKSTINKDLQSFTRTSTASNNLIQNFNTKS